MLNTTATYTPCKTTGNSPNKTIFAKNRWRGGTEPVYYFHSDHLGSASWITNNAGLPVQHLLYLPFGEHFANEHSSGYDERFTFTGKERDAETGYYYHGARFNSSDIGWLSVDPMAKKYPEITPYHYCAWNPIKYIDPDGKRKWPILKNYNGATRKIVSGMYRNSTGNLHGGVDIVHRPESGPPNLEGAAIFATHDGVVIISGKSQSAGNWIVIQNGNIRTKYMHMKDVSKYKKGDFVLENTPIGFVGNTGRSEGPHLHYQIEQLNGETKEWEKINPVEGDIPKVGPKMDVDLKDVQQMIKERDNIAIKIDLETVVVKETKKSE
jgi:RHS repeat-associated protein